MRTDCRTVVVVGAGFTGTIVTLKLNRSLPPGTRIVLCERGAAAGPGVAYGAEHPDHLLNVRAANMSAFGSEPGHFASWLKRVVSESPYRVYETEAGVFASRGLYGQYLASMLVQTMAENSNITLGREVVDLIPKDHGWRVIFSDGNVCQAVAVILATGNLPSAANPSAVYYAHPWAKRTTSGLRAAEPVLILGTGLTAVDLMIEIREEGFRGPVIALSRRGLLPNPHKESGVWPMPSFSPNERNSSLALLVRLRREVRRAQTMSVDWRSVVDSIRPVTSELWRGLPEEERARFLRHLRPYWDVHRHRMAPPVSQLLDLMVASGFAQVCRGRIKAVEEFGNRALVTWQSRGADCTERVTVQRIINATGVGPMCRSTDRLVRNLMRRGLARLDLCGLGLDVTDSMQILSSTGHVTSNLWALGPIVRGVFWECTAVPDIRIQAERVCDLVARSVCRKSRPLARTELQYG